MVTKRADRYVDFLNSLNPTSPDGSAPKSAIIVHQACQEYLWIEANCPEFQVTRQALIQLDGKPYDVLTLCNERGEQREVYFDISWFYGRDALEVMLGIPPRDGD